MAFGDLVKYARTLYLGGALAVEEDQSEVFFRDRSMSLTLDPPVAESLVLAYETAAAARVVAVAGETRVDAGRSAPSWDWIPVRRTISPTAGACSTRPSGVPRRVPRSAAREVAGVGASIRRAKPLVGTFALSVPGSARDRATTVFPRATPATTPRGDTCRRRKGKRSPGGSRMAPARCPLTPPAWRTGCWGFFVHREPPDRPLRSELSAKHDRRWSTCAARDGKVAGPATRVSRAVVALASPSASLASGTGRKYCAGRRPGRGAGHRTDDVRTATHRPAASRGRRPSRHGLDQTPRKPLGGSGWGGAVNGMWAIV